MGDNTYNHNKILDKNRYQIPKSNNNQGQQESKSQNYSGSKSKSLANSKNNPSTKLEGNSSADSMNKTAIALSYNPMDNAPKIIASGKGHLADKILKAAGEHHIPVHKDEQLANTLSKLEIGDSIPPELYEIVADILVFVDQMDRIKSKVLPKKE